MQPRFLAHGFVAAIGFSITCLMANPTAVRAAEKSPPASGAIPPAQPASSSEVMRAGYLALVKESIVPADPHVVGAAALEALATFAPDRVRPLPVNFGADAPRDAAWLATRVANLPMPWPVLDAMARAADTVHQSLVSPERRRGIFALITGEPISSPGFNVIPQPDGRLVIFDVVPGASAAVSGLRAGDVLVRVNGLPANTVDPFFLAASSPGAEVKLEVERDGRSLPVTLRLLKANVSSVESRRLDDGTAYLFLRWFAQAKNPEHDTATLVRRALADFVAQGARGLILDLRSAIGGNGEGSIASALCDGDVIYRVQHPLSAPPRPIKRDGARLWPARPIVVLINENTVSAGEDLALALRELGHAIVIGRTSGGGLTIFTFAPLADGYAMTIPIGVVLGPVSGQDQPGHAVKPDIEIANPTSDDLRHGRDRQLDAARAAVRNKLP